MRPPSRQILSVEEAFGQQGWHCELVEGKDVLRAVFTAHHTRIEMVVQAYAPMNALAIMGEMPLPLDEDHQPFLLELLARANKSLNLGGFEYDLDRQRVVFRITNLFDKERYDADIISSMVHCAVAEVDRIAPYATTVVRTPADLLDDLDIKRLLQREDFIPPVPGDEDDLP
ncbi:YbjN domain-containing protein [Luteolibacter sp. Populi]|uniref:YbjN domain-containing protein n=1 Tax=Luteolibacter sp. Populi TaxID=3230487 RepID=UPI0034660798